MATSFSVSLLMVSFGYRRELLYIGFSTYHVVRESGIYMVTTLSCYIYDMVFSPHGHFINIFLGFCCSYLFFQRFSIAGQSITRLGFLQSAAFKCASVDRSVVCSRRSERVKRSANFFDYVKKEYSL